MYGDEQCRGAQTRELTVREHVLVWILSVLITTGILYGVGFVAVSWWNARPPVKAETPMLDEGIERMKVVEAVLDKSAQDFRGLADRMDQTRVGDE